ncbi:winged helix-turn-helix transcriptional regulator [Caproiciproducens faecalis]|uniref:Helix-turn-helix transcriptional regulator n=1 Tax=Caproiciproducens faecalis TaxID=2820301 RepID=A0ABS7DNQ8_9FIRM|nr:helix-turn-helix domain-containing protein [Caproiciproducens faecalis]MBW7572944.1 helix-turn-helix transcriptional regulator [Caproiciproducens faecalis]
MKKDKEKKKKRAKRAEPRQDSAESILEIAADAVPSQDPLQYALAAVGGKWKLRILWALRNNASLRYGEIKQQIPPITDMMLSQSLRELTAAALIARQQFQQIPPKVEYRITPAGADLIPAVELLCAWALKQQIKGEK